MQFEEQFPLLKKYQPYKGVQDAYSWTTIEKNCRDVLRIREAIERNIKCDCKLFPEQCEKHKLLKELKL